MSGQGVTCFGMMRVTKRENLQEKYESEIILMRRVMYTCNLYICAYTLDLPHNFL